MKLYTRKILFTCVALLFCCLHIFYANGQSVAKAHNPGKAFISFRLSPGISLNEKRFDEMIALFNKYKGVTDEITFFTSETHPPLPLDVFQNRMKILEKRMQTARRNGYRSGINVLSTIGHHEENLENSLHGDYTNITDIEGKVSRGSYCHNDERFRAYIREIYKSMALAKPDYIWIDDDIRLAGHSPVYLTCFCDHCLDIFEKEQGKRYTRESLKAAVNQGDTQGKLGVRLAWLQHNRNSINRLFQLIEETVHAIKPGMPLGFMTGDRFFEGYDFANWAKTLAGKSNAPVLWRPGGGFYQDNIPGDMAGKSHDIGRQVSVLPADVVSIQSEVENYTYQRLKKSAHMTALEAASHIAAGCTGAAFNVMTFNDEPLSEYEPLIAKLHATRPFYDLMVQKMGRSAIDGVSVQWNKNSFASGNLADGNWFTSGVSLASYEMDEIGLPTAYDAEKASVVRLKKDNINALSNEEIEHILSKGVYLDGDALRQLNERGFGALTGFDVNGMQSWDRTEQLTTHALNGPFANRKRDNRQAIYRTETFTFKKTSDRAEVLSVLVDYAGKQTADCAMGIFENKLGGRICVSGYYPWNAVHTFSKSSQMKSVFRWLSKDTLPGYVASFHKTNLWIRAEQAEKTVLSVTNASFDPAREVVLMLRTKAKAIRVFDMTAREMKVVAGITDGPYRKFVLPPIDPWQIRLIETD
ncbi:hypothetical protein DYBT9275_04793 [Dyadobacter sp. CECT 9275]|uniref:Beta-galactosidase trimerisation domain-containing protein n=1 Tax=Dyadobacter helix TaxID=2822344 RepID=A0A916JF25_9BACT|nr:hypothetical protein [Dyadobacter sp. CECT 9275]CAG5010687.1 hypothetical protein DYBT9275_04793 [Dyadobacter sp. CECT 9275]